MIGPPQMNARVARLEKLVKGLTAELAAWKEHRSQLKQGERVWYLGYIESARAALRSARGVLASAVKRVEDDRRWDP